MRYAVILRGDQEELLISKKSYEINFTAAELFPLLL